MATTNSDLIRDALGLISVLNEIQQPSAEQGAHGLRTLNNLMAAWLKKGLDLQYYTQDSLTDDTPIPEEDQAVVTYYLSFALAPYYGKRPTPEMLALAKDLYDVLVRDAVIEQMREKDISDLPRGEASCYRGNILTG